MGIIIKHCYCGRLLTSADIAEGRPCEACRFIGKKCGKDNRKHNDIIGSNPVYGFDINVYNIDNKRQIMRNLVNPYLGLHILDESKRNIQPELFRKKEF